MVSLLRTEHFPCAFANRVSQVKLYHPVSREVCVRVKLSSTNHKSRIHCSSHKPLHVGKENFTKTEVQWTGITDHKLNSWQQVKHAKLYSDLLKVKRLRSTTRLSLMTESDPISCYGSGPIFVCHLLVGALSPVNHRGLHQGWSTNESAYGITIPIAIDQIRPGCRIVR